jgi:hypothetical protein
VFRRIFDGGREQQPLPRLIRGEEEEGSGIETNIDTFASRTMRSLKRMKSKARFHITTVFRRHRGEVFGLDSHISRGFEWRYDNCAIGILGLMLVGAVLRMGRFRM